MSQEKRPLRLLSCDGGGIRGVASLRILKALMKKVAEAEGKPDIKPCEYFDMIAGTSTGGLIALMLGRLHMTIEECEAKYDQISKQLFETPPAMSESTAFLSGDVMYDGNNLMKAIRAVLREVLGNDGADTLLFEENPQCKVLLMTALAKDVADGRTAVRLRNYKTARAITPAESLEWRIWEAGRATASAPVYFKRFSKNNLDFVDGGLGWNNPSLQLISELSGVYGNDFSIGCFVSVGTGIPSTTAFSNTVVGARDLFGLVSSTERTHEDCMQLMEYFPISGVDKYFRFNMGKKACEGDWVEKVAGWQPQSSVLVSGKATYVDVMARMDDWKAIPMIRALTEKWLAHEDVAKSLEDCVTKLVLAGK